MICLALNEPWQKEFILTSYMRNETRWYMAYGVLKGQRNFLHPLYINNVICILEYFGTPWKK